MAEKNRKLGWKIGGTIIGVCFVLIIIFLVWFFNAGSSKEIVAVADELKPGSDWQLTSEQIKPPERMCIDVACPSVQRKWTLPAKLTKDQVLGYVKQTSWTITNDKECFYNIYTNEPWRTCIIHAGSKGYKIDINIDNEDSLSGSKPTFNLYIEN
jgi:hypothetical protein